MELDSHRATCHGFKNVVEKTVSEWKSQDSEITVRTHAKGRPELSTNKLGKENEMAEPTA